MIGQYDHKLMSSALLWADHTILEKGQAFTNVSGNFYRIGQIYNGYYTYGLPFKQIIADQSIAGANILNGIYINNNFITVGQSGLVGINYQEGQVYFSGNMDPYTLSGRYAIKDINIYLTSEPEEVLLFETKFDTRPKTTKEMTGLAIQTMTFPAIFLKNDSSFNEPFSFGGQDDTIITIRTIVLADSQFMLDGVTSILRDRCKTDIAIFEPNEMPYNNYGGLKSGSFNYSNAAASKTFHAYMATIDVSRLTSRSIILNDVRKLNPGIFPAIIDIETHSIRLPRQ